MQTIALDTVYGGMGRHPNGPAVTPPTTPPTNPPAGGNTLLGDMCREAYTGVGAAAGGSLGAGAAGVGAVPGAIIGGVLGAGLGYLVCPP